MNVFKDFVYPLVGVGLVIAGVSWIYHPMGLIVAGICLLFLALARPKAQ